jgi:hypothetical protein
MDDKKKKKLRMEALASFKNAPVSDDKDYFDKLRAAKDKRRAKSKEANKDLSLEGMAIDRGNAKYDAEHEGMTQEEKEEAAARKLRRMKYEL